MARSRNIKPGFFKNEELGELSYETRLLFIGLWTLADREGRLEDRPRRIRAEIFPFDSIEVDPLLNELQKKKFILRYSVDKKNYIFITNFVKHQNPHYREVASIIPPPPGEEDKIVAKNVTRTQRLRILERDGYACQECGSTEQLCIDHILPVSRGGTSDDENLQVLCLSCNTKKGNSLSINYESNVIEHRPDVEPKHEHHVPLVTDSPILIPDSLNMIPENPNPVLELDLEPSVGSDLREEKTDIKQEVKERLFNLWNSQGIIEHRQLTPEISKAFDKALKKWDEDAIAEAIKRYGIIYHDTEYFFKHKWKLENFLTQKNALPDFLDEGEKWQNYQGNQQQTSPQSQIVYVAPNNSYYKELRPDGTLVTVIN